MLMFPDNTYGHIYVTSQGTLQIRGVQKEDAGFYVCSALSVAGSATIRAFLTVEQYSNRTINFHSGSFYINFNFNY